jgi:hypothetical protein
MAEACRATVTEIRARAEAHLIYEQLPIRAIAWWWQAVEVARVAGLEEPAERAV